MPRKLISFDIALSNSTSTVNFLSTFSASANCANQVYQFVPTLRKSIVLNSHKLSLPSSNLIRTRFVYCWTIYTPEVVLSRVKQSQVSYAQLNTTTFRSCFKHVSIMPNNFFVSISYVRCSFRWKTIIGDTRQHQSLSI